MPSQEVHPDPLSGWRSGRTQREPTFGDAWAKDRDRGAPEDQSPAEVGSSWNSWSNGELAAGDKCLSRTRCGFQLKPIQVQAPCTLGSTLGWMLVLLHVVLRPLLGIGKPSES